MIVEMMIVELMRFELRKTVKCASMIFGTDDSGTVEVQIEN